MNFTVRRWEVEIAEMGLERFAIRCGFEVWTVVWFGIWCWHGGESSVGGGEGEKGLSEKVIVGGL